jgi:membrane protein DedA with SNARE-associated domain
VGTFVAALHKLVGLDLAWLAKVISLIALPFAHEDLAIVLGGYIIVNDLMPVGLVVGSIYGGMVVSDFALYGIGAGARSLPWLRDVAVDERVRRFGDVLKRNIFSLVALCRLVPGVVFVAFVACGWSRVSLARFTVASLLVSAIYLPPILYLVIVFGDALDDRVGLWAWPMLLVALGATGFIRERVLAFTERANAEDAEIVRRAPAAHRTKPAGELRGLIERVPSPLFQVPLVLHWIALGFKHGSFTLPSAANPAIPSGGMWGESKSDCLASVGEAMRPWIADFVVLRRRTEASTVAFDTDRACHLLAAAGIDFPVVARPDFGFADRAVQVVADATELNDYLARFPGGAKLMLQRHAPDAIPAVAIYARLPGEARGQVLSLVVYDRSVADGRLHLTRDLDARIDAIARSMPEFHYGAFEIRFDSIEALAGGEHFKVMEIRGIGGPALEIGHPGVSVAKRYRQLLDRQRILFMIGACNRARGFMPTPVGRFLCGFLEQYHLTRRYPAAH